MVMRSIRNNFPTFPRSLAAWARGCTLPLTAKEDVFSIFRAIRSCTAAAAAEENRQMRIRRHTNPVRLFIRWKFQRWDRANKALLDATISGTLPDADRETGLIVKTYHSGWGRTSRAA